MIDFLFLRLAHDPRAKHVLLRDQTNTLAPLIFHLLLDTFELLLALLFGGRIDNDALECVYAFTACVPHEVSKLHL